jgi:DNA-binding beta-propeller fold protein YncE
VVRADTVISSPFSNLPDQISTMRALLSGFIASLFLACAVPIHAAEPAYHVTHKEILPGAVRWDYLTYDAGSKRLFITRGDHVDVYDTKLGRMVGRIANTPGVHGVALAPGLDRGFTSNGGGNTVTAFELSSLKVLATLPAGEKPDAIVYDRFTGRVFAANGDSGTLTVIDAAKSEVLGTVDVGGKLEFAAADGKGRLYVNVESKNALAVVDTVKLRVLARYDLSASCEGPAGLAIDPGTERLFVGCRNQNMAVVAGRTGQILATVPIGKGCDATAYDGTLKLAFSSNGEGTLTIISADTYAIRQTLATQPTARTMALDASSHRIYTVAADREPPIVAGVRPRLTPGTFTLLTVSP